MQRQQPEKTLGPMDVQKRVLEHWQGIVGDVLREKPHLASSQQECLKAIQEEYPVDGTNKHFLELFEHLFLSASLVLTCAAVEEVMAKEDDPSVWHPEKETSSSYVWRCWKSDMGL